MILHEIGYLIVGSVFNCWLTGTVMTCPTAGKVKPASAVIEKIEDYESTEVHYEVNGIAVFDKKDDVFEIRKRNGQKIQVSLSELKGLTEKDKSKATPDGGDPEGWHYESLEDILKSSMLGHETDVRPYLKKDDLKSPMVISKEQLEELTQKQTNNLLKGNNLTLPIGYFEITTACTYKKISATQSQGTCKPSGKAIAYKNPDRGSEKILDASLTWAHLEGRPKQISSPQNPENREELLVFEEQGDWVRMKLAVLEESKRTVWLNKKDIPYKLISVKSVDRVKVLIDFLKPPNATSSVKNENLADNLKMLIETPLDLDVEPAGEAKWVDGILWLKVNVRSEAHCTGDDNKTLATGWLPYIDSKSKKKILSWISRGC